ncbi:MAG: hypothetical protein J2O48_10330, partial [Solirubrobacterales bacterium]|nr:hypothetical protein [Solirubrobacterales bacterium]
SAFSALHKPVRLPKGIDLQRALRNAGPGVPASYDPTHAALLANSEYLIPAKLPTITIPRNCAKISGTGDLLSVFRHEVGSGPGVCLVSYAAPAYGEPATSDGCESLTLLNGYFSPLLLDDSTDVRLPVPDGVSHVQYMYRDGKVRSLPVTHNLVAEPPLPSPPHNYKATGRKFTATDARLMRQWLTRALPTEIRWRNSTGALVGTHHLPRGLLTSYVQAVKLLVVSGATDDS